MRKPFILLIVLLLAVTACSGTSNSGDTSQADAATPTAEPTVAPTPVPPTATAADAGTSDPAATNSEPEAPGCYADSITSLIDLQPNTAIAAVSASDPWQSGGDITAPLTVVEYGDFQ